MKNYEAKSKVNLGFPQRRTLPQSCVKYVLVSYGDVFNKKDMYNIIYVLISTFNLWKISFIFFGVGRFMRYLA